MPRKSWCEANPKKYKQYLRKRRKTRTARIELGYHLKWKYGITLEQYEGLLAQQHGVCAICREPECMVKRGRLLRLSVDHNHNTNKVRALLCNSCNTALGMIKENPLIARALAEYLETSSVYAQRTGLCAAIKPRRQLPE